MTKWFFSVICFNLMVLAAAPVWARTLTIHDRVGCATLLSQQKRLEALWRGVEAELLRTVGKESPASKAAGAAGFAALTHISQTQCTLLRGSFKVIETRTVRGIDLHKLAVPGAIDQWIWTDPIATSLEKLMLIQQSTAL